MSNILDRANYSIAQGALTNSKRPASFVQGVYPTHLVKAQDAWLWDVDGRKYLDYICGLGTNFLGYNNRAITSALTRALDSGIGGSMSLSSVYEVDTAERLKELFPFVHRWKFLKTGSEACNAAIRIARAATGREMILSEGYHGWGDDFVCLMEPAAGVPTNRKRTTVPLKSLDQINSDYAAVIVEPVMTDMSEPRIAWLSDLRKRCSEHGVVLIFDEVITGFRYRNFAVANDTGIKPDLICLGKAIANGMPLAAVGGLQALMDDPRYFVSSTYAGEVLSLVAAKAVLDQLTKDKVANLWDAGQRWIHTFNSIWPEGIRLEGYPTRGVFIPGNAVSANNAVMVKALLFQEACRAGILFGPSWFFNFCLADSGEFTLDAVREILCLIKNGAVQLKGKLPIPPLAQMMRESK